MTVGLICQTNNGSCNCPNTSLIGMCDCPDDFYFSFTDGMCGKKLLSNNFDWTIYEYNLLSIVPKLQYNTSCDSLNICDNNLNFVCNNSICLCSDTTQWNGTSCGIKFDETFLDNFVQFLCIIAFNDLTHKIFFFWGFESLFLSQKFWPNTKNL